MQKIYLRLAGAFLLFIVTHTSRAQLLNTYFGNLHAHSTYSDGNADDVTKTPAEDYAFAKTALCMDFLGISEHNHTQAGMHLSSWAPGIAQATAATTANFIALHGMEWGVISGGGHVVVYGIDSLIGWEPGEYQIYVPKNQYTGAGGLFDILNRHGQNAFGYMAHPNSSDYNDLLNGTYDVAADNAVVGTAVESGPAFSTETNYNDPGTSMSYLSYYRNMLSKGYHLGPTIDHDNHNMTFGHTAKTRLAILAPSLSEANLLDAMRRMRFYATQDCNARISFSLDSQPMGSIFTSVGAPEINVNCVTTSPVSSIKIMFGVPGSGSVASQLAAVSNASTFTYTDNGLANLSQRYYYLDILETDGTRIITSPIWFTRNDAVVLAQSAINSFVAINEPTQVQLKWTTINELPNTTFIIERSVDGGVHFSPIGSVAGRGTSNQVQAYAFADVHPVEGLALYRIVEQPLNSAVYKTDTRSVTRTASAISEYVVAYPNPVRGTLYLKISSKASQAASVLLYDITGRLIRSSILPLASGEQVIPYPLRNLSAGNYVLRIKLENTVLTQHVDVIQ